MWRPAVPAFPEREMSTYKPSRSPGSPTSSCHPRAPEPEFRPVRIAVESCGVCHSDVLASRAMRADPSVPMCRARAGRPWIEGVGDGCTPGTSHRAVSATSAALRRSRYCRRGDFVNCADQPQTGPPWTRLPRSRLRPRHRLGPHPGGAVPRWRRLRCCARPDHVQRAGPGRWPARFAGGDPGHRRARPPRPADASKLGYRVAAIRPGTDKAELAAQLGADHYIDSAARGPGCRAAAPRRCRPVIAPRPAAPRCRRWSLGSRRAAG